MAVTLTMTTTAHEEPVRESARSVIAAPAVIEVPARAATGATMRNIFAPLPAPAPAITNTLPTAPSSVHLADFVDTVNYQDVTEPFTDTEKKHIDDLLSLSFSKFPSQYVRQLDSLTLKKTRTGSRGLGGASVMILRTLGVKDTELVAVSIHELGHVVDMGVFKGTQAAGPSGFMDGKETVWADDQSVAFYKISWNSETDRRSNAPEDFVSGYAMSDPFEDEAETFAMYVLHGERFRTIAGSNTAMASKYAYMRDRVFGGREFRGIDAIAASTPVTTRPWDVTLEPYSWAAFQTATFTF